MNAASTPSMRAHSRLHRDELPTFTRLEVLAFAFDLAAYQGYVIPPYYDFLLGKLIVHGRSSNRGPDAAEKGAG